MKVDHRIIITGIICLTVMFLFLILYDHDNSITETIIVGIIGLSVGVVIPYPKIDNKRGFLVW